MRGRIFQHTIPEIDWDENFILSSQVWPTAGDLTRLGVLHLQDGVWNGQGILPEGWVRYVTTPAPAQEPSKPAIGYGAQWWLFNGVPDLPNGSYAALGHGGRVVMVMPSIAYWRGWINRPGPIV